MDNISQKKLAMATRVREFIRAHPLTDAGQAALFARFEDRIARAESLAGQQRDGRLTARAATARRHDLRDQLQRELLPPLVTVARAAARELPALMERFAVPEKGTGHQRFLVAARGMSDEAHANQELFLRHGLGETLLDELAAILAEYEATVSRSSAGRQTHVGARADIQAVTREIMELVEQLDVINLYRFRTMPDLRAAWRSARDLPRPQAGRSERTASERNVAPAA